MLSIQKKKKNTVAQVLSQIMIPFKSTKSRFHANKGVSFSFHSLFRQVVIISFAQFDILCSVSLSLSLALSPRISSPQQHKKIKKLHVKG